ncbi:ABC transporter permease [Tundrisphaera lichenicola]|uniref:ABC transporter permease n=1 Tax=Tundrisphaera lichenicola TaxID=2029860 RepID=UPI003EB88549
MIVRPLIALVSKDLRVFFTERHSVILSFAAPIALASFMAAIFGGAGPSVASKIPIVIVDEDHGPIAAEIIKGARSEARLEALGSGREVALGEVRLGRAVAAVVIPEGFGEAAAEALLGGSEPPELTFIHDPTHRSEVSLAQGLLTRVILEAVSAESLGDLGGDLLDDLEPAGSGREADESVQRAAFLELLGGLGRPEEDDPELASDREEFARVFPGLSGWLESPDPARSAGGKGLTMPYTTREESIAPGGPEGEREALAAHAFAGMVVQFVLFSAVEWGVGLLVERQRGLWKRLRVAPVSRSTLMTGKVLGCLIASILIVGVVFGFGALTFGFRVRGDFAGLLVMALAFSWMAANFGLMVAAFGRSPQGARSVAVLAVLVMVMLGGGWIPSFLFPEWLQQLTPAIPTRWAIDGFDGIIARGYSLREAAPALLALGGFGAGFGCLAHLAFRWSEPG